MGGWVDGLRRANGLNFGSKSRIPSPAVPCPPSCPTMLNFVESVVGAGVTQFTGHSDLLDPGKDCKATLGFGLLGAPVNWLALLGGEAALRRRVVIGAAHRFHGRLHAHHLTSLAKRRTVNNTSKCSIIQSSVRKLYFRPQCRFRLKVLRSKVHGCFIYKPRLFSKSLPGAR